MEKVRVLRPSLHDVLGPIDSSIEELLSSEVEREAVAGLGEELGRAVEGGAAQLGWGQVVAPPSLLADVTAAVFTLAGGEPCGVRGGVVHVVYDEGPECQTVALASMELDPTMPNTFELLLTLGPDTSTWFSKMARIIKPLRKSGPLVLSPHFLLQKRKLYPEE